MVLIGGTTSGASNDRTCSLPRQTPWATSRANGPVPGSIKLMILSLRLDLSRTVQLAIRTVQLAIIPHREFTLNLTSSYRYKLMISTSNQTNPQTEVCPRSRKTRGGGGGGIWTRGVLCGGGSRRGLNTSSWRAGHGAGRTWGSGGWQAGEWRPGMGGSRPGEPDPVGSVRQRRPWRGGRCGRETMGSMGVIVGIGLPLLGLAGEVGWPRWCWAALADGLPSLSFQLSRNFCVRKEIQG